MTLEQLQKSCQRDAAIIKIETTDADGNVLVRGYEQLSKSELANYYCDWDEKSWFAQDLIEKQKAERMRSAYWSAIMLRYWYKIYEWKSNSASLGLEATEFFNWLYESLDNAFYYRSWRPHRFKAYKDKITGRQVREYLEENPQYVDYMQKWKEKHPEATGPDPDAADRSINYFTGAKRGKEYQAANKDKRSSNYGNKIQSYDQSYDEDGHSMLDRNENLAISVDYISPVKDIINIFLQENKVIEALVVDGICNGDTMKENKHLNTWITTEVTENEKGEKVVNEIEESGYSYSHELDRRKLVKHLNSINEDFLKERFTQLYKVNNFEDLVTSFNKIKGHNDKWYKAIDRTIETIRQTPRLRDCLGR